MDAMFTPPTNKAEYIQLLDEAIRMADDLNAQLDRMEEILEEHHSLPISA